MPFDPTHRSNRPHVPSKTEVQAKSMMKKSKPKIRNLPEVKHKGTVIVKPGQYRGVFQIGIHTDYKALVQIGDITVDRDKQTPT
jgi:hypothetical protein